MIDLSIDLSRVWQVDLSWNSIGNEGAKAIGAALRVNGALTEVTAYLLFCLLSHSLHARSG